MLHFHVLFFLPELFLANHKNRVKVTNASATSFKLKPYGLSLNEIGPHFAESLYFLAPDLRKFIVFGPRFAITLNFFGPRFAITLNFFGPHFAEL